MLQILLGFDDVFHKMYQLLLVFFSVANAIRRVFIAETPTIGEPCMFFVTKFVAAHFCLYIDNASITSDL